MALCEYCGRPHAVQIPDQRFCSVHCRLLLQQFLEAEGYTPDGQPTTLDYALTEADYLARHLVALAKRAAQLLHDTDYEEAEDEQGTKAAERLDQLTGFLEDLAQGNSVAEKIEKRTRYSTTWTKSGTESAT
jgi:hypothetical protein